MSRFCSAFSALVGDGLESVLEQQNLPFGIVWQGAKELFQVADNGFVERSVDQQVPRELVQRRRRDIQVSQPLLLAIVEECGAWNQQGIDAA